MAQYSSTDNAANSVLWAVTSANLPANSANRDNLFGNVTVSAFVTGQAIGQFGASNAEVGVAGEGKSIAHAGWQLRRAGTGSVVSFTINTGGSSYTNANSIRVTSTGGVNATANITTNSSGGITSLTVTNLGSGFTSLTPTVTIVTATGSGANVTATAGGRAGRVHYETLVAMSSIASDASDDTQLPNS